MEDETKKQLRTTFNIRNTRSRILNEVVPTYKTLTSTEIYTELRTIYEGLPLLLGSFNGIVMVSESRNTNGIFENIPQIETSQIKTSHEFAEIVYSDLYNKLFRVQSRTYKRISINGVIYDAELFRNYTTAKPIIDLYITTQPIQQPPNTQPLLLHNNFPNLSDGNNSEYNLTDPKLCVYNEVLTLYNNQYKKKKTLNDLLTITIEKGKTIPLYRTDENGDICYNGTNPIQEILTITNIIKNGANKEILILLCNTLKIPLNIYEWITNDNNFKLCKQSCEYNKRKGLNVLIENNHIYLLNDIKRFMNCETIQETKKYKQTNKKDYIIITNDGLTQNDFIRLHMPTFIKIKNGIFNDFTIKNKKFIVNPIKEFMTYYGAKYTGQTPQSVANSFLNDIKKSKMSDEIYNILTTNNIKHRTHADTIYPEYFTDGMPNDNGIKKYDLNKAYRYVMEHMDYLYDLDINQTVIECNKLMGDGLYFVECETNELFHGKNWYSLDILQYATDNNIEYKILYYIKTIRNNQSLKEVISKIEQEINNTDLTKLIINSLSGLCGITANTNIQARITSSVNTVLKFITNNKNIYVKKEGDLYLYGFKKETKSYNNRLLIYIQILDKFNMLLHERIKGVGGLCVARHIDAFYVLNPINTNHLTHKVGDFKSEDFKPQHTHKKERGVIYNHNIKIKKILNKFGEDLTLDDIKNGTLINGIGGSGKTTAIKRLKLDAIFLAPTNKASLLIGGKTIHNFLSIDIETDTAIYPKTNKTFCIIDEASMITVDLWFHLLEFKRTNPHMRFIIMGDIHQLPSIEDIKYFFNDTPLIMDLVNHNIINLTKNYRQDNKGLDISNKIINNEMVNYPLSSGYHEGVNICYYNLTRRRINKHFNKPIGEAILLNEDIEIYGYLYEGVKIMCNKTYKNNTDLIFNGEEFIVKSVSNDMIFCTNNKSILKSMFSKYYTLGYAITVYKAQGSTYDKINIYDMDIMTKNYRFIYTAISRSTSYDTINFLK